MKKQRLKKLLTSTAVFLACTLLVGTLPLPTPTEDEENPIIIEIPSSEDDGEGAYSPLGDEEPWGDPNE